MTEKSLSEKELAEELLNHIRYLNQKHKQFIKDLKEFIAGDGMDDVNLIGPILLKIDELAEKEFVK